MWTASEVSARPSPFASSRARLAAESIGPEQVGAIERVVKPIPLSLNASLGSHTVARAHQQHGAAVRCAHRVAHGQIVERVGEPPHQLVE